jgi:hypothetical protein
MRAIRTVAILVLTALAVAGLFNGAYWLIAHFLLGRL